MPPRKKISAPEGRVYKSTIPLKQTKLQEPRKHINSYGKSTSKRIARPDNTLTQMDYVIMNQSFDEEEDMELFEAEPVKPKKQRRKAIVVDQEDEEIKQEEAEKRKKRRRRTAGDNEEEVKAVQGKNKRRKTIGDVPSSSSKFYTQTLTQIESWSSKSMSPEVQQPEDDHIFSGPSSSQMPPPAPRRQTTSKVSTPNEQRPNGSSPEPNTSGSMGPPQTPHRRMALEIPSSQSPATPFSCHSRTSPSKRSPLRPASSNTPIRFSMNSRSTPQKKTAKLVIQDTFSTAEDSQSSHFPSSPSKRSSPAKSVRFADAVEEDVIDAEEEEVEEEEVEENVMEDNEPEEFEAEEGEERPSTPTIKREPVATQFPSSQKALSQPRMQAEILDSEAESDVDDEDFKLEQEDDDSLLSEKESAVGCVLSKEGVNKNPKVGNILADENEDEEEEPETYYGEIGLETQMQAEHLLILQGSTEQVEETQELQEEESQATRSGQSQRISLHQANLMAPRTINSDIFISLHPPHVRNIVKRKKDHEFRTWTIPDSVVRIWIYETAPASKVKYMAAISAAKRPGEILDERGIGNAEFNRKSAASSEVAYEILDLYELATPQTLAMLKEKEWMKGPPQRMAWVRPAVLDDLMGNLKPPIFTKFPIQEPPASLFTDTQEAEAQLFNTIQQFTQPATEEQTASSFVVKDEEESDDESEHFSCSPDVKNEQYTYQEYTGSTQHVTTVDDEDEIEDEIEDEELSSHHHSASTQNANPRPSQAETVDLTQSATPKRHELPDIIMESPTRPVPSSTPRLPSSTARMCNRSDSIMPLSSQLMTKSQMLPESLLNDSVPAPPDFIEDSDEEE